MKNRIIPFLSNRSLLPNNIVIALTSLIMLLMGHYGILCICVDSLFLQHYSYSELPQVWLLTAIITVLMNSIYNFFNRHTPVILLLFIAFIITLISVTLLLNLYRAGWVKAIWLLKALHDAYFVVLLEACWAFISLISFKAEVKRSYGFIMAGGTCSTTAAYFIIVPVVALQGTVIAIWYSIPLLMGCIAVSWYLYYTAVDDVSLLKPDNKINANINSFQIVWNSKFLTPLLLLMLIAKISIALVDFEFSRYVQLMYPDTDLRTTFTGNTRALISALAVLLQLAFPILLRSVGAKVIFLSVPITMAITLGIHIFLPWVTIVITRICYKALDYSFFKLSREILYIPLNRDEKTKGKACIDIFMFRIAGGLSALLLAAFIYLEVSQYLQYIIFVLQLSWLYLSNIIIRRSQTK